MMEGNLEEAAEEKPARVQGWAAPDGPGREPGQMFVAKTKARRSHRNIDGVGP